MLRTLFKWLKIGKKIMNSVEYLNGLKDGLEATEKLLQGVCTKVRIMDPEDIQDLAFNAIVSIKAMRKDISNQIKSQEEN